MPNTSALTHSLRAALASPNLRAFLAMIRACEGTADADGVRRLFGGELIDDLSWHPNRRVTRRLGRKVITSTAAGAFQFLHRTWTEAARATGVADFSLESQEIAAAYLIRRRKALADVLAGRWSTAVRKCAKEWASLPGSPYGQPTVSADRARRMYLAAGGEITEGTKHAVV